MHHDDDDHHHHHDEDDHDHEDDHYGPEDHEKLHLEMHRAVDELGKYAMDIELISKKGLSNSETVTFIDDFMKTITKNCMDNGADIVGHVKSFLSNKDGSIMASIVDHRKPTRIKNELKADVIKEAKIIMHIIVHGLWDDKVREHTLEVLDDIFTRWNLEYRIVADYFETEKSAAHHQ